MDAALLDTDMLNEVLKQKNANVMQHATNFLRQHGQFAMSCMSRYEIMRGLKEKAAAAQLVRFAAFCEHTLVLPISDNILDRATDLWVEARRIGQAGRDADLIIAATAMEHDRVLVTGNTNDFSWISGLRLMDWRTP